MEQKEKLPKYRVTVDVDGMAGEHDLFREMDGEDVKPSLKRVEQGGDYRLSDLTITSMDMCNRQLKAKYMGYGVVRLYREYEDAGTEIEVDSDDTTVAIVAVPSYLSPTEVLAFLGESITKDVSHFRMIKSENPNRFMVLMKFRSHETARSFQEQFNEIPFSSIEAECCHIIFVKSVMFRPLNVPNISGIPYLLEDPFTLQVQKSSKEPEGFQNSVVKELPTCPVCLERMDSDITGLVTISCQHTFHCNCLSKWRDDTCPVCRYSNLSLGSLKKSSQEEAQHCSTCGSTQNLWICLICGNIGCGRYDKKHAIEHYERESHCFAMDIATQRVWDYAGDNYVHRLLQNESDGKLVELPSSSTSCSEATKSKNRDYSIEYSNVLLSQLESQREYYESRLAEAADVTSKALEERDSEARKLKSFESSMEELIQQLDELKIQLEKQAQANTLELESISKAKTEANTHMKKWKDEQLITDGLSKNLDSVKEENERLKSENLDLQEQVKDLMFFLESQEKFKNASDEVKNGTIVMQQYPQRRSRKNKR
jgi:BRCA1-associated protein